MRDTWGPPLSGGWPTFDENGKRTDGDDTRADFDADAIAIAARLEDFDATQRDLTGEPIKYGPHVAVVDGETVRELARKAEHDRLVKSGPVLIRRDV